MAGDPEALVAPRPGIPEWVPRGQEDRWRNAEKVASEMFPGDAEQIWSATRAIFNDRERYPD